MDEKTFVQEARLAAIEYMIAHLTASIYRINGVTPDQVHMLHGAMLEQIRNTGFPPLDPAGSDALSAEMETAVARMQRMTESLLAAGQDGKP
jgi:hypothetical protein